MTSIWWWAAGYFACYVPYAALTKALSSGLIDSGSPRVTGIELLPPSVLASAVTITVFLAATGWWRRAGQREVLGRRVPWPGRWTALSGLCSSGIIATTTLAYAFDGVSIVFIMLLLRGGVLVMAPVVDAVSRRRVRWFSWVALALSILSLLVATLGGNGSAEMTVIAALDVGCYLGFYFVRLSLMSHQAKSTDRDTNLRYFVEEQLVSVPALLVALGLGALLLGGDTGAQLRAGFTSFWDRPIVAHGLAIGVLSQGTGICGGLILLDTRENTFSIPVNRASSILAGVVSSALLAASLGGARLPAHELAGAAIIVVAIGFLTLPTQLRRRRARR